MRAILRYLFLFLLALVTVFAAGFFLPYPGKTGNNCIYDTVTMHISSNGFHTSFILPVRNGLYDWHEDFSMEPEVRYVEFGWGNKDFYMSRDFSLKATLEALFPSKTVVHVAFLGDEPERWFSRSRNQRLQLCPEDYESIVRYIRASFQTDSLGNKIYLGEGLYGPSSFFKGKGRYHAFNTCNTWVAEGLRQGHEPTPLWPETAQSIMWHLEKEKEKK